jgi:hypothetical protein
LNIAGSPSWLALYFGEASHVISDVKVMNMSSLRSLESSVLAKPTIFNFKCRREMRRKGIFLYNSTR